MRKACEMWKRKKLVVEDVGEASRARNPPCRDLGVSGSELSTSDVGGHWARAISCSRVTTYMPCDRGRTASGKRTGADNEYVQLRQTKRILLRRHYVERSGRTHSMDKNQPACNLSPIQLH